MDETIAELRAISIKMFDSMGFKRRRLDIDILLKQKQVLSMVNSTK